MKRANLTSLTAWRAVTVVVRATYRSPSLKRMSCVTRISALAPSHTSRRSNLEHAKSTPEATHRVPPVSDALPEFSFVSSTRAPPLLTYDRLQPSNGVPGMTQSQLDVQVEPPA
jgi:hypothetical protein